MSKFKVTPEQKKALSIAALLALVLGAWLLKPYFILLVISGMLAFLYAPVYQRLLGKGKNPTRASMLTLVFMILTIAIPVILIIFLSINQVDHFINSYDWSSVDSTQKSIINSINELFAKFGIDKQINLSEITKQIQDSLKAYSQEIVASIPSIFSSFLGFITSFIIFIYVFLSMLRNQRSIKNTMGNLNPLGNEISNYYLEKIGAMTKAMVKGQFIIAVMQGFESAIVLAIAGLPELFFFFAIFLTALSFIPMGAGIVTIPIGVLMILTGNVWQGILVIANHLIIVTNIDNVMRPRLIPPEAKLDPALTILSVFAGIHYFGFLGIVIGPVAMIIVTTTLSVFLDVYRNMDIVEEKSAKKRQSLLSRVKGGINNLKENITN